LRQVLKLPAFRRLFAAYTLNELALSIGSLTLAVLVYRRTGSAYGAAAFFLSSQFVPALFAPALVTRFDRRPVRIVLPELYGLEALAFVALGALASSFSLAPVLLLAFLDGVLALTARALARTAAVTVTAPVGLLREGNAFSNTAFSICFMVGPAIGGAIVAAGGTVAALYVNSGLFVVMALMLGTASGLPGAVRDQIGGSGRLRAALRHAARAPGIRTLLGLQSVALLFFTISIPVEVVFAQHSLHAGAGGYGGLLTAWGAGAIAGSAIYARWRALSPRALISIGAGALGLGFLVMATAPSLAPALIGAAAAGCGNGIEAVAARTSLQEIVEEQWMARIMSLNESMFQAVPGVGIILGGLLAGVANARVALAVAGWGALLVTAAAWALLAPSGPLGPSPPPPPDHESPNPDAEPASVGRP
jgi:predicted MFS family arabinose efflux permease